MRNKGNWQKFTGKKVLITILINAVILLAVFVFFGFFLQGSRTVMQDGQKIVGFTAREVGLCLLLYLLINSIIFHKNLLVPIWQLENEVRRYRDESAEDGNERMKFITDNSIETVLKLLIQERKIANEWDAIKEKQRKSTELYALQSQIDPHFLYNALDSIRGYALIHDMDRISDIIEALSRVFRNMISDQQEYFSIRQERDNINNYMKVQQFRFNNKFDYSFEVDEDILDKYMVPRMVLQPLVENAIMHGLERKVDGGWIKARVFITERRLMMEVIDNGAGISEERLEFLWEMMKKKPSEYGIFEKAGHTGIALININSRIKLSFGDQYGIYINSIPYIRTTSELVLPLLINRG